MREKSILVFSENDEEFVDLLISIGVKRQIARALVYLINMGESTMHAIELGTGLSQPEVSTALKCLVDVGWVSVAGVQQGKAGRPKKLFSLALPAGEILKLIGDGKKAEIKNRISLIRKARASFA